MLASFFGVLFWVFCFCFLVSFYLVVVLNLFLLLVSVSVVVLSFCLLSVISFVLFLIHMSNTWICVMSCVRLAGRPAILHSKNFYMQTLSAHFFFVLAMLISTLTSTILYHFY